MMDPDFEMGIGSVEGYPMYPMEVKASLSAVRVSNGYVLTFRKGTERKSPLHPPSGPPPDGGMSEEEKIDAMVEAIAAFTRHIGDKGAGDEWRDDGDREKIRAGFKALVPASLLRGPQEHRPPPPPEQLVFQTKSELIKFIEENF
jgi:hypothetical protein